MKIHLSKRAIKDLDEIFLHVSLEFTKELGFTVLENLRKRITNTLSRFSHSGRKITDKKDNRYMIIIEGNKVFYQIVSPKLIKIVRIIPRGTSHFPNK